MKGGYILLFGTTVLFIDAKSCPPAQDYRHDILYTPSWLSASAHFISIATLDQNSNTPDYWRAFANVYKSFLASRISAEIIPFWMMIFKSAETRARVCIRGLSPV